MPHWIAALAILLIGLVWGFIGACIMFLQASYKPEFWKSFFYMADIQKITTVLQAYVHRCEQIEKDEKK